MGESLKPLGALQRSYTEKLASVCRTVTTKRWPWQGMDERLRKTIQTCLIEMQAIAFIAHFHPEDVTLSDTRKGYRLQVSVSDLIARTNAALSKRNDHYDQRPIVEPTGDMRDSSSIIIVALAIGDPPPVAAAHRNQRDYLALAFPADALRTWQSQTIQFPLDHAALTAIGALYQVLRQRVRVFSPFSKRVSERYWEESLERRSTVRPPWERKPSCKTASLSIDLRKSTFCMEQAVSPEAYARWIDQLVQILVLVGHKFGGVFDKFTGDGALVHFVDDDCKGIYGCAAAEAALKCAAAMHYAVGQVHLPRLREILRFNSDLLGAAIGIDHCDAFWSLDHRLNPIVVGRGVVNACRLSGGPKGTTRLSNAAYRQLGRDAQTAGGFRPTTLDSKEFNAAMRWEGWDVVPESTVVEVGAIRTICNDVYKVNPSFEW